MPDTSPQTSTDPKEIATRNDTARHIVAGFSAAMPTLAEIWRSLEDALSDVPALSVEVARLYGELRHARLDRANLLAAARATIAAHHDGELDPLSYLRDELDDLARDTRRRA
jgi:hypothetical protein